jgi:glycosyltransferase involved in cell wall biosynthesis
MNVLIDTSPLNTGHAMRGIGTYTRLLTEHLEKQPHVAVCRSETEQAAQFKPDLIHYPYFDLYFNTLPMLKKRPTVVTIHDVIPLKFRSYYPVGIKGKATLIKQRTALRSVAAIITDSEASKADIIKHLHVSPKKIHVVYLAANPEMQAASEQDIRRVRRAYKLPQNYVLYVGDINYNKNIPQLIKATRFLPSTVKLVAVGKNFHPHDIPEWQWIETQLALSDVEGRVKFITDVQANATADLAAIYSGALCYVQPSLYEGFGLPVLEAMQSKTPVVVANNSSLPEIAGDDAVYVETTAEGIAEGINTVLDWSASQRNQVISNAYAWSQRFSWDQVAQETVVIYNQVLNNT